MTNTLATLFIQRNIQLLCGRGVMRPLGVKQLPYSTETE